MTIIDKRDADIDARFRSLLQKAVRRGNVNLVYIVSALIQSLSSREKNWFRNRSANITFEECWPLGQDLNFNRHFHSKVAVLIKVARSVKNRDASGLGYLAYRLYEGDASMLGGTPDDRPIKIVANAIRRPEDFWSWLERNLAGNEVRSLCINAMKFKSTGRPLDRAVIQAAAYLSAFGLPAVTAAATPDAAEKPFPYWVVLDRHTPEGKRALNDVARDLHISHKQLEWSLFYFEGSVTNGDAPSPWWERSCSWQFQKLGLPAEEAHLLWEPAKPQLIEALAGDSRQLQREIYSWKLANQEPVETLKKAVELFIPNFESGRVDQLALFRDLQH
jgi:hypothetical protein